jgi:nicotinamidase/pyrazinamidase
MVSVRHSHTASFDVDAQQGFSPLCPDELPVPDAESIVPELNAQANSARYRLGSKDAHSAKAVWVADQGNPQFSPVHGHANVDIHWRAHCMPGTRGFELLPGLPPISDYDFFVWKGIEVDYHPYGACWHDHAEKLSTGVIEFLGSKGVDTVIVGGLATDYCVKLTVAQLRRAGFGVVVNLGACRGIAPESTDKALAEMRSLGVQFVQSASEIDAT